LSITSLLHRRARWFVALAWLLVVLAVFACLTVGIGSAINDFYHPQHEWAGHERALVDFLQLTFWIGAAVAVGSSLALALRWRIAAAASVVVCWVGLVLGGTVYLNSVQKGPQYFDRYAGEMHFRIPWQFGPSGSDSLGPNGFYVSLCVDSLLATYDKACRGGEQVSEYPPNLSFAFEELSWQRRQNAMKQAGARGGYEIYIYSIPAERTRSELTLTYYRRANAEGKLLKWVICHRAGSCDRGTLMGGYVLVYNTTESAFSEWDTTDQKLAALVDSWAVSSATVNSP
jgi:hypothetical protein